MSYEPRYSRRNCAADLTGQTRADETRIFKQQRIWRRLYFQSRRIARNCTADSG